MKNTIIINSNTTEANWKQKGNKWSTSPANGKTSHRKSDPALFLSFAPLWHVKLIVSLTLKKIQFCKYSVEYYIYSCSTIRLRGCTLLILCWSTTMISDSSSVQELQTWIQTSDPGWTWPRQMRRAQAEFSLLSIPSVLAQTVFISTCGSVELWQSSRAARHHEDRNTCTLWLWGTSCVTEDIIITLGGLLSVKLET